MRGIPRPCWESVSRPRAIQRIPEGRESTVFGCSRVEPLDRSSGPASAAVSLAAEEFRRVEASVSDCQRELLDAVANLISVKPQQRGGFRLVASCAFECLNDQAAFELFEVGTLGGQLEVFS
jgi:hypothetical protein